MKLSSLLALLLLLPGVAWAEVAPYRVIVHPANPVTELTSKELSKLFLKKTASWEHGPAVEPVDLPADSEVRQSFTEDVHGRSVRKIETYWQRKIFSGESVGPEKLTRDAEVVAFVASHPGAIGYVGRDAGIAGARAIDVVTLPRPLEREPPRYSMTARQQRIEGTVVLQVTIDTHGRVTNVVVKEGLPAGLTQEAVRALELWRFEPATRNGEPVEWEMEIPLGFKLD